MKSKVIPTNGGCWFCCIKDKNLVFDMEFDTYVHTKCIVDNYEGSYEAEIMKYLLEPEQLKMAENKPCEHPYDKIQVAIDPANRDTAISAYCSKCDSYVDLEEKRTREKVVKKLTGEKVVSDPSIMDGQIVLSKEFEVAKQRTVENLAQNLSGIGARMNNQVNAICTESSLRLLAYEKDKKLSDATILLLNDKITKMETENECQS